MRTTILVSFIVAAILAACSDDRQPTSPATAGRAISTPTGTATDKAPSTLGKPVDHVGFTQIADEAPLGIPVAAGAVVSKAALCPAGSVATGGGYQIQNRTGTPPFVYLSIRTMAGDFTGWLVGVDNTQAGSGSMTLEVSAICAS